MRSTDRRRRRKPQKQNNGCAVFVGVCVIAMIILLVFLMRSCTSKINDMFGSVSDSILEQQYPIKFQSSVEKYSKKYKLDKYLVYAVIKTESGFDQYAVSKAGAYGLMQLQTETASDCAKKLEMEVDLPDDLYEPDINIHIGTYYLSWLLEKYDGNISLAVAAYNGGIGNIDSWLKDDRYSDGSGGLAVIPFSETRGYVDGVNSSYKKYKEIYE